MPAMPDMALAQPASIYIKGQRSLDRYLPPTENLLENGNFEDSPTQLTGWTASGVFTPTVVTGFSGQNAAGLGYDCTIPCLTEPEIISSTAGHLYVSKNRHGSRMEPAWDLCATPEDLLHFTERLMGPGASHSRSGNGQRDMIPSSESFNDIAVDARGACILSGTGVNGLQYRERQRGRHLDRHHRCDSRQISLQWRWTIWEVSTSSTPATLQHCPGTPNGTYYIERSPSGTWGSPVLINELIYSDPVDIVVGTDQTVHFLYAHDGSARYRV